MKLDFTKSEFKLEQEYQELSIAQEMQGALTKDAVYAISQIRFPSTLVPYRPYNFTLI